MRAGIIGAGFIGQEHMKAMRACEITDICICDSNREQAQRMADQYGGCVYTDYEELLRTAELDFISICTPTVTHYALAAAAVNKGIAVLCEKPFTATVNEAMDLIRIAKEKHTLLMVAHCLRFAKAYTYLKRCMEDGRYGRLLSLTLFRHSAEPLWSTGNWLKNCQMSGGATIDLHIHETDMAVFLLGMPRAVTTVGSYTQCATVYHYDDQRAVSAQASWRSVRTYPLVGGYDANFEQAVVRYKGNDVQVYLADGIETDVLTREVFPDYISADNPYEGEMRYFLHCLSDGKASYCDPEDSMRSLKVVHAELDSLLQHKTICLK